MGQGPGMPSVSNPATPSSSLQILFSDWDCLSTWDSLGELIQICGAL